MIPWWWSWLLTAIGVTGLWVVGNKKRWGWVLNISVQALWIVYAVTTEQWGFILSALVYGFVFIRNWRRWAISTPTPTQ